MGISFQNLEKCHSSHRLS